MTTALTHWYSGFLRRRRTLKHFGRHPLANAVAGRGPTPAPAEDLARDLLRAAREDPAAAPLNQLPSLQHGNLISGVAVEQGLVLFVLLGSDRLTGQPPAQQLERLVLRRLGTRSVETPVVASVGALRFTPHVLIDKDQGHAATPA